MTEQSTAFVASIKHAAEAADDPLHCVGVWAFAIAQVSAVVIERALAIGVPHLYATQTFVACDAILDYLQEADVEISPPCDAPASAEDLDTALPALITGMRAAVNSPYVPAWPFAFLAPTHA